VKVLTSETPAKVVIEIKDGEGNILHTLEIPEEGGGSLQHHRALLAQRRAEPLA